MLTKLHDLFVRILTWVNRNRKYKSDQEVTKVNLGAGLKVAPGWYNIDGHLRAFFSSWPEFVLRWIYRMTQKSRFYYTEKEYCQILRSNRFIHHDLKYGIPFYEASVDFLYCSHLLEHLHRDEAVRLVKEAYRVLKPGGVFRICVPDLAYAVSLYQKGKKVEALRYFFCETKADYYTYHRYLYDFELLKDLLLSQGFSKVERCQYQKGRTPDIELLDNRPEETLYVEAIK